MCPPPQPASSTFLPARSADPSGHNHCQNSFSDCPSSSCKKDHCQVHSDCGRCAGDDFGGLRLALMDTFRPPSRSCNRRPDFPVRPAGQECPASDRVSSSVKDSIHLKQSRSTAPTMGGDGPMSLTFRCPECQEYVHVCPSLAGLHTHCPSCDVT